VQPFTIIDGPAAWKGADLRKRPEEWIYHLAQQVIRAVIGPLCSA